MIQQKRHRLFHPDSAERRDHYRDALRLTVNQNLASGAVYDALHLIGARSARCDNLFTLNLRHFRSLAPGDSTIISP
ncbi:MAG: hypothetical protein U1F77_15360 [Kiritimatiellia bacterium]